MNGICSSEVLSFAGRALRCVASVKSRGPHGSQAALAAAFAVAALAVALMPALDGCATNPVTGKSEFSVISEKDEITLGTQAYEGAIAEIGGGVQRSTAGEVRE